VRKVRASSCACNSSGLGGKRPLVPPLNAARRIPPDRTRSTSNAFMSRLVRSQANEGRGARDILNPVDGYRGEQQRKGNRVKDHAKENRRNIREKQRRLQQQKAEHNLKAEMPSFKMQRFKEVQSRVKIQNHRTPNTLQTVERGEYRRPGSVKSTSSSSSAETPRGSTPGRAKMKPAVPTSRDLAELAPRSKINFLHANAREAINSKPPSPPLMSESKPTHKNYGKVPVYLEERKMKWAQMERKRVENMEDPNAPPGMKLMDEGERRETLRVLQDSLEQAKNQLFKLPLTLETPSQLRKKTNIEAKMKEMEDAIKLFSRQKVYVAK